MRRTYALAAERPAQSDQAERALLREAVRGSGSDAEVHTFASHLAAHGDPRAALFDHAGCSDDALDRAIERWIEPSMQAELRGGFPVRVRIIDLDRIPLIERLPWVEVVQELLVAETEAGRREAFEALLEQEFPALRALEVRSAAFGYAAAVALTRSRAYPRLESLRLVQCALDVPAITRIVATLPPSIRELRLAYANGRPKLPLRPTVGDAFMQAAGFAGLELLDLTDCSLGPDDVLAILGSAMPRLRHLILTGNELAGIDPERMPGLPVMRQLQTLMIGDTQAEPGLVRAILDHLDELSLKTVVAPGDWSDDEMGLVARHPNRGRLEISFGDPQEPEQRWLEMLGLSDEG